MTNLVIPNTFEGGKNAIAQEVNENFSAIKSYTVELNNTINEIKEQLEEALKNPSKEMFDTYYSISSKAPSGAYPLWTGEYIYNAKTLFPEFWTEAVRRKQNNQIETVETNNEYDDIVEEFGQCSKFFIDELNGHIRLPMKLGFLSSNSNIQEQKSVYLGLGEFDLTSPITITNTEYECESTGFLIANRKSAKKFNAEIFVDNVLVGGIYPNNYTYGENGGTVSCFVKEGQIITFTGFESLDTGTDTIKLYPCTNKKLISDMYMYIQVVNNTADISTLDLNVLANEYTKYLEELQAYKNSLIEEMRVYYEDNILDNLTVSLENITQTSQQAISEVNTTTENAIKVINESSTNAVDEVKNVAPNIISEAQNWAIGTIEENPDGSAKYWAESISPEMFAGKMGTPILFSTSTTWTCPKSGKYIVTLGGGGGGSTDEYGGQTIFRGLIDGEVKQYEGNGGYPFVTTNLCLLGGKGTGFGSNGENGYIQLPLTFAPSGLSSDRYIGQFQVRGGNGGSGAFGGIGGNGGIIVKEFGHASNINSEYLNASDGIGGGGGGGAALNRSKTNIDNYQPFSGAGGCTQVIVDLVENEVYSITIGAGYAKRNDTSGSAGNYSRTGSGNGSASIIPLV